MFINVDYEKRKHKAKIQLAKPNKKIISNISEKYNISLSMILGGINELNFSIPHMIVEDFELVANPHVDLIKEKMLLKVTLGKQAEWFIVDSIDEDGGDKDVLKVTAFSLGFELTHKRIGYYQSDATDCAKLIGDLLEDTTWTIGSIDDKFTQMKRFFEATSSNALDSLIEASSTFGAIISWDTDNRKISFKDIKNIGKFKGLSVDYGKLLKSISKTSSTDEMTTRLYIYGNEDISIQSINPTGQSYIEDFSYFMYPFERDVNKNVLKSSTFMSDELCHAILDHKDVLETESPNVKTLVDNSLAKQTEVLNEESALTLLQVELEVLNTRLDVAKSAENTTLIGTLKTDIVTKETEISNKQAVVNRLKTEYLDIELELETLRATILRESNFTIELLNELSFYIIEKEWSDDRYIDPQELYDDGLQKFIEIREPKVVITVDIENLFEILEEQHNWNRLVLGDFIKVRYAQMNLEYLARIVQIDHDIEDGNIKITIANTDKTDNEMEQLKAILSNSQSASTLIQRNLHKWNKISFIDGEVTKLINDEWDANKKSITAGVNNQIEIGKRGIIIRNPDYPDEVVIIQSGIIALSKDNGDTWKTAIKPDGIIAERLIGKVILGTSLIIEDENGIMTFSGSLQQVFDNNGVAKVEIGEYETGVYGMRIDNGSIEIINGLPKNQIDPNTVAIWDNAEQNAKTYADNLKTSIDTEIAGLNTALTDLDTEINSTFKDGIISEAEAKSIETYINIINSEKSDTDSRYNSVYNSTELTGTAKTNLDNAKTSYDNAHTALINSINNAISDGKTTQTEKTDVDTQFGTYKTSIGELVKRLEEAIDFISQAKVDAVNIGGRNLLRNSDFETNSSSSEHMYYVDAHDVLKNYVGQKLTFSFDIKVAIAGTVQFYSTNNARYRIPTTTISGVTTEYQRKSFTLTISDANNTNTVSWLEFYGTYDSGRFVTVKNMKIETGNKATDWTPAPEDIDDRINLINQDVTDVSNRIDGLDIYVDGAFSDGIIEKSEAIAIAKYINSINSEKADIDSRYTNIYNNSSVKGTYKTNLATAKNNYNTAHTNLIDSINTAIADGKTTSAEKTDVDTKFTAYRTSLSTLSTRLEEAVRSMDTSTAIRTDLNLTAPLPTSISLNADGITATTATSTNYARLDYRGLYVQGGAINIKTSNTSNRGIIFDSSGLRGYNANGVKTFEIDVNGNGVFKGDISGATGSFSGSLSGATGSFSGSLSGATGSFSGSLSGASGTFSGSLSGASGTFGTITSGTFSGVSISGASITGGSISSNASINVTTNAYIGDKIYFGYEYSKRFDEKGIVMYDGTVLHGDSMYDCRVTGTYLKMDLIARTINLFGRELIDFDAPTTRFSGGTVNFNNPLSSVNFNVPVNFTNSSITWGSNAPVAKFG